MAYSVPVPQPNINHGPQAGVSSRTTKTFTVGDLVHFAVQDPQYGSGPTRHGSVVLYIDGDRALLASSPGIPNVKVMDFGTEKVGMTWVRSQFLGKGHKNCQTTLNMSLEAAWNLRGKILLATTGDVNETMALRGRGSPSVTDSQQSDPQDIPSSQGTPSGIRSPDQELHAMVRNALVGFNPALASPPVASSLLSARSSNQPILEGSASKPPPVWFDHQGSSANMAGELHALISSAFDDGIQAFRAEQKNMDKWVASLQQQLQKVTGNFLVSFGGKLESEMDRRLTMYSESVRNSCLALDAVRGKVNNDSVPVSTITNSSQRQHAAGDGGFDTSIGQHISSVNENDQGVTGDLVGRNLSGSGMAKIAEDPPSQSANMANSATSTATDVSSMKRSEKMAFHLAMLDKIEEHKRRSAEFHNRIGATCACYQKECVPPMLTSIARSSSFNNLSALVTLAFACAVGIESNINIVSALDSKNPPTWIGSVVDVFNVWFIGEVSLRILAEGVEYFIGTDCRWNIFDFTLVVLSIVDMAASTGAIGFVRIMRSLKILRAFRVVRVLRLFHDLRLLLASMLSSMSALLWSLVILFLVNYIFAVMFIQGAVTYINEESRTDSTADGVEEYYQTIYDAMYTLTSCITGGLPWTKAAKPVWGLGWVYGVAFVAFVLFNVLGILNVIKGIFVERAANMKQHDPDFAITEKLHLMENEIEETMNMFDEMDVAGNGEISLQDLEKFLAQDRVVAHFAAIGIDVNDRSSISHALIENGRGSVNIKQFVTGCIALRGTARQSDTVSIVLEMKKLQRTMERLHKDFGSNFRKTRHTEKRGHSTQGLQFVYEDRHSNDYVGTTTC